MVVVGGGLFMSNHHTGKMCSMCFACPPKTKLKTTLHTCLALPSFSPPLSLFTNRACLPVQEDVCSAHFNMNTVIFYLAAICSSVINQHEPAVFILQSCRTKFHMNFLHYESNVIIKKETQSRNPHFWWLWKIDMQRINIWPLASCINWDQIVDQTSIFHLFLL